MAVGCCGLDTDWFVTVSQTPAEVCRKGLAWLFQVSRSMEMPFFIHSLPQHVPELGTPTAHLNTLMPALRVV